jgi:dihydroflavonol-4-reductase
MLNGSIPGAPRIHFGVVDVRDVADLHLLAMTHPAARGERFIAAAGPCVSVIEVARLLRTRLGARAAKVPSRQFPDFVVRLFGLFNPAARAAVPQLGVIREASSEKARTLLGWRPISNEEAILATAESLVRLKLLKTG